MPDVLSGTIAWHLLLHTRVCRRCLSLTGNSWTELFLLLGLLSVWLQPSGHAFLISWTYVPEMPCTGEYKNLGHWLQWASLHGSFQTETSAYFFGPVVGALAGGIGSAMADILTGYAIWALPTLLIKTIMPVIACAFFKNNVQRCKVFSIRGIAGAVVTLLFMTAGYVFFGGILYCNFCNFS